MNHERWDYMVSKDNFQKSGSETEQMRAEPGWEKEKV